MHVIYLILVKNDHDHNRITNEIKVEKLSKSFIDLST